MIASLWQYILSGVVDGAIFALVAAGFVLIYQVTGLINFAQGEFAMIGAMTAASLATAGMPTPAAAGLAVLAAAVVGAICYLLAIRPARAATGVTLIFITLGLDVALRGLALFVWGTNPLSLNAFSSGNAIQIFGGALPPQALWVLGSDVVVFVALYLFFRHTYAGTAVRAAVANPPIASTFGIPLRTFAFWSFVVAAAIGGIGGVMIAPITSATYDMGLTLGLAGFVAAVLGGLDSLPGALLGGFVLGIVRLGTGCRVLDPRAGVGAAAARTARPRGAARMTAPATAPAATLEVRSVTKRFGGVVAVDDVTFSARTGEVLGVMGPNGAGKTTLFNVISGVQRPTSGDVSLRGLPLTGRLVEDVASCGVTRTFQTPVMFWGLTVRESVEVALAAREFGGTYPPSPLRELVPSGLGTSGRLRARAELRERADAILTRAGIAPMADRATESLAFGEERLLELARALAVDPTVLLLDEPLSGLNPDEIEAVIASIRAARASGVAVLLVEHAVGELLAVADRVVVLDHGRMIAQGSPTQVAADPVVIDAYIGDELE